MRPDSIVAFVDNVVNNPCGQSLIAVTTEKQIKTPLISRILKQIGQHHRYFASNR